jgi:hypothetical protein
MSLMQKCVNDVQWIQYNKPRKGSTVLQQQHSYMCVIITFADAVYYYTYTFMDDVVLAFFVVDGFSTSSFYNTQQSSLFLLYCTIVKPVI